MPDVLTTRISGLAEAEKLLAGLPDKLASTCVRKAMLDAAKIGKAALKAEAEKHDAGGHIRITKSGRQRLRHLSDTAIYTTRRFANGVQYSAVGFAWPEGAQGWLVDKGHRMVTGGTVARISGRQMGKAPGARSVGLTGAGRVVGFVKPHPIALPAFEQALGPMQDAFRAKVAAEAETALRT